MAATYFRVWGGNPVSSPVTGGWHSDCVSSGTQMALDIAASEGDKVRCRVTSPGAWGFTAQFRTDCTNFRTGTPSSVAVKITVLGVGTYVLRYTHLENIQSWIGTTWSAGFSVLAGGSLEIDLGGVAEVSQKKGIDGWDMGGCGQEGGTTDPGGLCSSGPHLHQAASNGSLNGCQCVTGSALTRVWSSGNVDTTKVLYEI